MTQKQTTILGFVTLIAVLAALWLLFGEDGRKARPQIGPLLPGLAARVNAVDRIVVAGPDQAVTIRHHDALWRIEQKEGYPAEPDQVRELLTGLARAEIVAQKTDNPALYDRIGLGETATRVTLSDEGEPVADLFIGERRFDRREWHSYVRLADSAQTVLVKGLPQIEADPDAWLPDNILQIARARIAAVRIEHADGEVVEVRRNDPTADFELVGKAEAEAYVGFQPAGHLANALSILPLKDVRPADALELAAPPIEASLRTFDGLFVVLALFPIADGGDAWVRLDARYEAVVADAPEVMPEAPADTVDEAQRLDERAEGWAYRLAADKVAALTKRRADIVGPQESDEGS